MKKQMKQHKLIVLLTLLVLLLSACGAGGGETGGEGGGGGGVEPTEPPVVVTEAPAATPVAPQVVTITKELLLDPANASDPDSLMIVDYLYEGLVKLDGGSLAPELAVSWTVSDDGLDYIFTLRQGVTFHDGTALNADAVIANFTRWFDKEDAGHRGGDFAAWGSIFGGFKGETGEGGAPKSTYDGAEKVDDYTVLIHLTTTDANFLAKLVNPAFSIVSPAAFGADYYGTSLGVVGGTGMYRIGAWDESVLMLEPNPVYWGGIPLSDLVFQFK